jgi:hypothetical protein
MSSTSSCVSCSFYRAWSSVGFRAPPSPGRAPKSRHREIGRDTGRPKRMIADRRRDANRHRPPADHPPRVRLQHGLIDEFDAPV